MLALYPGTFDPITRGHIDIVARAAQLFDEVVVALAKDCYKSTYFSVEERFSLAQAELAHLENVTVETYQGLTVNFAKQKQADLLIRGLRGQVDVDAEFQLAGVNKDLAADIETCFLRANPAYVHVSSSWVRHVFALGGDVSGWVGPAVLAALEKKQAL